MSPAPYFGKAASGFGWTIQAKGDVRRMKRLTGQRHAQVARVRWAGAHIVEQSDCAAVTCHTTGRKTVAAAGAGMTTARALVVIDRNCFQAGRFGYQLRSIGEQSN
jgi:hypothetical protein